MIMYRLLIVLSFLLLAVKPSLAQNIVTFDDQGWNPDQPIPSDFTIGNFKVSSTDSLYTNYGYNFNVYNTCIYVVFLQKETYEQNPESDQITITTLNNATGNLNSIAAYQVSESNTDTLLIEGWNGSNKTYERIFSNINTWQTLTLNYENINKIVVKLKNPRNDRLYDYNFDNISFSTSTDVESTNDAPQSFSLSQNYPNPFNPSTEISWQSPVSSWQTLKVYDILGNEVATLVDEEKEAGSYSATFSAGDLSSGMYIYTLTATGPSTSSPKGQAGHSFTASNKMLMIK